MKGTTALRGTTFLLAAISMALLASAAVRAPTPPLSRTASLNNGAADRHSNEPSPRSRRGDCFSAGGEPSPIPTIHLNSSDLDSAPEAVRISISDGDGSQCKATAHVPTAAGVERVPLGNVTSGTLDLTSLLPPQNGKEERRAIVWLMPTCTESLTGKKIPSPPVLVSVTYSDSKIQARLSNFATSPTQDVTIPGVVLSEIEVTDSPEEPSDAE